MVFYLAANGLPYFYSSVIFYIIFHQVVRIAQTIHQVGFQLGKLDVSGGEAPNQQF